MAKRKGFDPRVFRKHFQQLCKETRLNQMQLAAKIGLTQASISRYLSGSPPNVNALVRIARSFGVSMDWLCGLKDQRK
jgi:transcriptional regulator with XRE-family HTH domain